MSLHVWQLRDDLFIRGMFHKRPDKIAELEELGIDTVICMLRKTDPDLQAAEGILYQNFPLPDTATVKVETIEAASDLAVQRICGGHKVLIHCISSRDRAPTTAARTLTKLTGLSGTAAREYVHSIKPTTFTNKAFVAWLNSIPASNGVRLDP